MDATRIRTGEDLRAVLADIRSRGKTVVTVTRDGKKLHEWITDKFMVGFPSESTVSLDFTVTEDKTCTSDIVSL